MSGEEGNKKRLKCWRWCREWGKRGGEIWEAGEREARIVQGVW